MDKTFSMITIGNLRRKLDGDLTKQFLVNNGFVCQDVRMNLNSLAGFNPTLGHKLTTPDDYAKIRESPLIIAILCVVNNFREEFAFGLLAKLKKLNKNLVIGGCFVGACDQERLKPYLDEKTVIAETSNATSEIVPALRSLGYDVPDWDNSLIDSEGYRLQVQRGCRGRCSFCVIKRAIGKPKSISLEEVEEKQERMEDGYGVLGEDLGCWGMDIGKELPDLLKVLDPNKIGFFGCIAPDLLNEHFDALEEFFAKRTNEKIFGIESDIQSGSNRVLELMERTIDIEKWKKNISKLRERHPNFFLLTDVMAGFPTETETEWLSTVRLIKDIAPERFRVFKYSPRHRTLAAKMQGQLTEDTREKRCKELRTREVSGIKENVVSHRYILYKGPPRLYRKWV